MENNEKLILKVQKSYAPATAYIRINPEIADRIKAIANEINKEYSTVACELLEFALDRVEIVEWGEIWN